MLKLYFIVTEVLEPFLSWWLAIRKWRGKEDPRRLRERYGYASKQRPKGLLLWLHAASVGEANSVLELIGKLKQELPHLNILLTTGTVTSARLMAARLPKDVIHQYVPLDVMEYTRRFMRHWKPELAFFVESELWPNLIETAYGYRCFTGIINGRMSARSYASWKKHPEMIRHLLSRFNCVFAQSEDDAKRFKALGASDVRCLGNLKYDAALLPCDEAELLAMKEAIAGRPAWLAASTHPGEEEHVAQAHRLLSARRSNLLTFIVPRHPGRGQALAAELRKHGKVALRSRKEPITSDTAFYVADTIGELGLFYRLCDLVCMGGSLVKHGGQNPLEAARLSCAIVTGSHTYNFRDIYREMAAEKACVILQGAGELASQIDRLLSDSAARDTLGKNAKSFVDMRIGTADRLVAELMPIIALAPK